MEKFPSADNTSQFDKEGKDKKKRGLGVLLRAAAVAIPLATGMAAPAPASGEELGVSHAETMHNQVTRDPSGKFWLATATAHSGDMQFAIDKATLQAKVTLARFLTGSPQIESLHLSGYSAHRDIKAVGTHYAATVTIQLPTEQNPKHQ